MINGGSRVWQSLFGLLVVQCILAVVTCLSGCAVVAPYRYPAYHTFTEANKEQLRVGMTANEVQALFGKPNEVYNAAFGEDVGPVWKGRVWLYFTEPDSRLRDVTRYKKNLLVFYPCNDRMTLNHWVIEE